MTSAKPKDKSTRSPYSSKSSLAPISVPSCYFFSAFAKEWSREECRCASSDGTSTLFTARSQQKPVPFQALLLPGYITSFIKIQGMGMNVIIMAATTIMLV